MAVYNNKRVNVGVTVALLLICAYYMWTAAASSVCTATGIVEQTRTTWAPVSGCVVSPVHVPWSK